MTSHDEHSILDDGLFRLLMGMAIILMTAALFIIFSHLGHMIILRSVAFIGLSYIVGTIAARTIKYVEEE